jgi:hypothetical protein
MSCDGALGVTRPTIKPAEPSVLLDTRVAYCGDNLEQSAMFNLRIRNCRKFWSFVDIVIGTFNRVEFRRGLKSSVNGKPTDESAGYSQSSLPTRSIRVKS